MEKNKNILIIILVIIIGLLCCTIGWLIGSKFTDVGNESSIEDSTNQNNDSKEENDLTSYTYTTKCNKDVPKTFTVYGDVSQNTNIFDYIKAQKDVSIKLNYCTNEIESEGEAGTFYKRADYNLTTQEINNFLNEMKNESSKYLEGGHSNQCAADLLISYKINGELNEVKISMTGVQILSSTDGNIYKIIDSNIQVNPPLYCLYSAGTSSQTINNIINNLN